MRNLEQMTIIYLNFKWWISQVIFVQEKKCCAINFVDITQEVCIIAKSTLIEPFTNMSRFPLHRRRGKEIFAVLSMHL